jgi:hypothetical protein
MKLEDAYDRDGVAAAGRLLIDRKLTPVVIQRAAKRPVDQAWGDLTWTSEEWTRRIERGPCYNVGVALGPIIDVECDGPAAKDALEDAVRLSTGELIRSLKIPAWKSKRGCHLLFRLSDDQRTELGEDCPAVVKTPEELEFRLGTGPKQSQSLIPPSIVIDSGKAYLRRWVTDPDSGYVYDLKNDPPVLPDALFRVAVACKPVAKAAATHTATTGASTAAPKRRLHIVTPTEYALRRISWATLLEALGWSLCYQNEDGKEGWTRPGGTQSSGTLGFCTAGSGRQKLYVFSSAKEVAPFQYGRSYSKEAAFIAAATWAGLPLTELRDLLLRNPEQFYRISEGKRKNV